MREKEVQRGIHKDKVSLKPLAWKMRRAELLEFLQPVVLKPGVLKVTRIESIGHCAAPEEKMGKQPRGRQCGISYMKHTWGEYLLF